jgi:two-component system, chemotaxis family, CheB/CheR fusion protein
VRPELQEALHQALRNAREDRAPKLSAFVGMEFDGTQRRVALLAQWRAAAEGHGESALVTFLDAGQVVEGDSPPEHENGSDEMHLMRARMQQAEYHADQMHDERYLASEDLRSANEELQSLNEEYRATTEELETSKEELQSINEELQTVNGELKAKLEEVSHAHSDMQNLVAATNIPILFLDRDLTINRFTPPFSEIFNVQAHDQGRSIADFSHHLDYETLSEDARRVLADQAPVEQEATSSDGRIFVVRLRPYRTAGDRIDGVVVTFVDVTELKRANQLQQADRRKDDFLAMLGHELRNPLAAIRNTLEAMGPKGEIGAGQAEWAWG